MIDLGSDWQSYMKFRDEFAALLDPARYTIGWLDGEVLAGEILVWATDNACILCRIDEYPTGARDIHGMAAAGDLGDIVEKLIPDAESWAKEEGCLAAVIESRSGWERVLRASGYELYQTTLRKAL